MTIWHQVTLCVPAAEADDATGSLWMAGARGVEIRDEPDGTRTLVGSFTTAEPDVPLRRSWTRHDRTVDPDEGLDTWRTHATVIRAGSVTVVPAWLDAPATHDGLTVTIEPGRVFGTGGHASTALALESMDELPLAGARVLDAGCGSGVLSVVAARYGASIVDAVDIDPAAVDVTQENAARNGVGDVVRASTTPIGEQEGPYDAVLANIGSRTLRELAPALRPLVAPGGHLVLSGMMVDAWPSVRPHYPDLEVVAERVAGEWICPTLVRPGAERANRVR